jgi:hypothetical protein
MANVKSSKADIVQDAERLLRSVEVNPDGLAGVADEKTNLEAGLTEVRTLITRQMNAIGEKQKATQELRAAMKRMLDLTIQLRAVIKAKLGPRSEKLVEYLVPPLRARRRKAPTSTPPPTTPPPTGSEEPPRPEEPALRP